MKKHTIYKYCHRPFPFKIVGLNREEGNMIIRSFIFTDSCKYLLDENDQLDWNKLYGVSFGLFGIHKNSVRFVWRYNPKINKIQIGAYWYLDGYRNWYLLCSVELNQLINFKITFLKDSVVFTVLDDLVPIAKYQLYIDEKTLTKDKYQCGIYFGGNRRAPKNITIVEKY